MCLYYLIKEASGCETETYLHRGLFQYYITNVVTS